MKRLVGGDFLLDVSSIELEETSTLTNITDKEVISQLTNLKKYIPNPSMIKPVWVKLHDGDGKLVVARGSLSVVDTDEFELDVILNGYTLKIHVEFTQVLNEDDDPVDDWYIATNDAKYLFTTNNFATFKVADVKNIDGEILSQLKCGDVVIKEDASGEHAYIVTYRGETGICLTYADASVIETQSYDKVGGHWVYNSEDKTPNLLDVAVKDDVKPIYCHPITIDGNNDTYGIHISMLIFDNSNEEYNTYTKLVAKLNNIFTVNPLALFPITGGLYYQTGNSLHLAQKIVKEGPDITLRTMRPDGTSGFFSMTNFSSVSFTYYDGVNKIN